MVRRRCRRGKVVVNAPGGCSHFMADVTVANGKTKVSG